MSSLLVPPHAQSLFSIISRPPPISTLFPYTTLFRSQLESGEPRQLAVRIAVGAPSTLNPGHGPIRAHDAEGVVPGVDSVRDRKSTRLNSSHLGISYAVFCLKKKRNEL